MYSNNAILPKPYNAYTKAAASLSTVYIASHLFSVLSNCVSEFGIQTTPNTYNCATIPNGITIMSGNLDFEKVKNLKKLDSFLELQTNWNENGAKPFQSDHILFVKSLIMTMDYQPEIFPTACETIQLEFYNDKNDYFEFEIDSAQRISMYKEYHEGTEEERSIERECVLEEIEKFYGSTAK